MSGAGALSAKVAIAAVVHGSVSAAELRRHGLSPEQVLDFSVNTNPLGPAPSVLQAIATTDWSRYPGDDEATLRSRLGDAAGVSDDCVALGNGSVELIWCAALACLDEGAPAVVHGPTFGEYARAVQVARGRLVEPGSRARLGFVCNPNNPTGSYLTPDEIERLSRDVDVLVVDEAYAPFVDARWDIRPLLERGNVIVLRSMTKDHALPGLRLGYALASPEVAGALRAVRPPWSVNAGALRAGLAALERDGQAHVRRACDIVAASRALLTDGFLQRGYTVTPSAANFVLVEVGNGAAFRERLVPRGIVVRDCASFGLPSAVRVACRLPEECARLFEALDAV